VSLNLKSTERISNQKLAGLNAHKIQNRVLRDEKGLK
jgi:hypothetical protein